MAPTLPDVLHGPRTPLWGCACGAERNWASKIRCRCGRSAPQKVLIAAKKAHGSSEPPSRSVVPPGRRQGPASVA
eukprot:3644311-Pyramimonas_sp.AAC.1